MVRPDILGKCFKHATQTSEFLTLSVKTTTMATREHGSRVWERTGHEKALVKQLNLSSVTYWLQGAGRLLNVSVFQACPVFQMGMILIVT